MLHQFSSIAALRFIDYFCTKEIKKEINPLFFSQTAFRRILSRISTVIMNLFKLLNYRTCLFTDNHFPLLGLNTKRNWIFTEYFCKAFLALKNSCLELSQEKKNSQKKIKFPREWIREISELQKYVRRCIQWMQSSHSIVLMSAIHVKTYLRSF